MLQTAEVQPTRMTTPLGTALTSRLGARRGVHFRFRRAPVPGGTPGAGTLLAQSLAGPVIPAGSTRYGRYRRLSYASPLCSISLRRRRLRSLAQTPAGIRSTTARPNQSSAFRPLRCFFSSILLPYSLRPLLQPARGSHHPSSYPLHLLPVVGRF